MKKLISLLLAFAMVFSLAVPGFAAETTQYSFELTMAADKETVNPGENVTLTVGVKETLESVESFEYHLMYDSDKFEFVSGEKGASFSATKVNEIDDSYVNITGLDTDGNVITVGAGTLCTVTFQAKEAAGAAEFSLVHEAMTVVIGNYEAFEDVNVIVPEAPITVTVAEAPSCEHSYVAGICTECGETDPDYVAPSVDVTLSLSRDAEFMVGASTGEIMAFKDITVPYFDLGLYGLEEYYFISESYGDDGDGLPGSDLEPGTPEFADGKVTLMHLYLYALEVYYCGVDPEDAGKGYLYEEGLIGTDVFSVSGGVGSSFMDQFWGGDCNLNYYVNYEYPLASEGWGATADQILLRDGDMITLGHFSGWSFYGDTYSIFNYILSDKSAATQGEEVTLTLMYAGANMGTTDGTAQNLNPYCLDVYCTPANVVTSEDVTTWTLLGTSDENGQLVVDTTDLEPGEYIVAVAGQYGVDYSDEICSTPGGVKLTVKACQHNYVDGVCGNCGAADPNYVAPSNDVVLYSSETGMVMPGGYDIVVTEVILKNAKDKVFIVDDTDRNDTSSFPAIYPVIFLNEDVAVGEVFELDYKAIGADAASAKMESDTFKIQSYLGVQGSMKVRSPDYYSVDIFPAFWVINKFALNYSELTLTTGEESTLALSTNQQQYVTNKLAKFAEWTSSDESVATVDGGKVTAVAPGTATVTATVGNKTAACTVTVESNDAVVFEGEAALSGNADVTITELILKDAKNKVFANYFSPDTGNELFVFLDGDKAAVGDSFEFAFTAEGADKDKAEFRIVEPIFRNKFTIQSYGYDMGQMQIQETSTWGSVNFGVKLALVTKFGLNSETLTLTTGNEGTLSLSTNSGDITNWLKPIVEWTTSDESVATVDGGKVTAVAPGTATITAKVGNKTATCTVTVVCEHDYFNGICTKCSAVDPDYVAIETIQLTSPSMKTETDEATGETVSVLSLIAGGSEKLTAVLNEGATQGVIWSSENEGIAKVDENGVVTAVSNGTTTITATAGDTATTFAARNNPVMASVKVTVTDLPEGEYYTVTLAEDKTVVAGETIEIPVTVGHSNYLHYNAWDMTFTYDSTALKLTTESSGETFTVTAEGNTIRVQGYGENLDADTAAFTLTFEALKAGSTELTLDSAKVDNAGHAIGNDAPEATVIDGLTVLTITGYPVTLPQGFEGEGVAAPGKDYTFSAPEDYYDYTVEIKVGGETVEVTPVDGTWTIPGDAVDGDIVITQTGKEGKNFEVDLGNFMNGESTAQHGTNYSATLNKEAGYTYSVTVKIGGENYNGAEVSGDTYTISGGDITGKIEFIVERNVVASTALAVTFTGTGAGAADGNPTTVKNGADYVLTLTKAKGYLYTVKVNGQEVEPNAEGKYVIEKVTAALTIEIERTLDLKDKVSVHEYVNLDGKTVFLVLVNGELDESNRYTYDGNAMYYSYVYEAWATLTVESGSFTAADASAKVDAAAGNKMTISSAECDVNNTGTVDINDAQLTYDVYKGNYEEISAIGMAKYLWADVNADMKVDVTDAQMVVANIK